MPGHEKARDSQAPGQYFLKPSIRGGLEKYTRSQNARQDGSGCEVCAQGGNEADHCEATVEALVGLGEAEGRLVLVVRHDVKKCEVNSVSALGLLHTIVALVATGDRIAPHGDGVDLQETKLPDSHARPEWKLFESSGVV